MRLAILRLVLVCHALALFAQSVFAGEFLSGRSPVRFSPDRPGWIALALAAIQIILAAAFMRSGTASLWLLLGSVFVLLGEALQVGSGYARFLSVHVPLNDRPSV